MAIPHGLAIRLLFLLILPILWALPGGHLPTLLAHPELPGQLQCFARCVAKCLVEDEHKSLSQCQTDCRQYGQPSLCGPQELARGKRGTDSSSSREHQDHRHGRHPPPPKLSKNGECWARCKDLGLPPPSPPPPPPSELRAQFNENLTIDIHWKLTGPGAEKDRLFLIQLMSEVPNRQISQIFAQKASGYSGLALASAESICGPVSVQVAAVDAARGLGPMSKPVQLEGSGPRVPARMQLFATKFNSTPFETDDYEVNGTLDVELQFQLNSWPFGLEDVEVNPVFHLVGCAEPDLSQAMPAPEFEPGTQPNTVLTHLGADMMYRRCRFVYAVEEVRSNKCGRQYPVVAGQHDFQSIEFSCDTVEDSTLAPGNVCTRQKQGQPPVCGQFDKFRYSVIEESNDSATREERLSVNITFLPLQRVLQQKPKYYVAIYGNAIKSPNRNNLERLIAGVNMTDVLGEMTNCAKFAADKSCLRFYSDNSIILDGLKRNTSYGVVLCAVLDPANLTFPPMIGADKSRKPQAFGLYLPAKGQHRHPGTGSSQEGGGDGADDEEADTEEEEEEHKRKKAEEFKAKRVVRLLVAGAVLLVALLLLSVGIIFCWLRRQKEHLRKKRLNLEAMRRGREQRYTDFPSRRDDPWELERRNLILYEDKRLGAGAFGSVYLGKLVGIRRHQQQQGAGGSSGNSHNNHLSIGLLRAENTFVAVKMLPEYADEPSKSDFLREIGLMKTLGYHERLVNMLACVTQSEPYCLVVEFCSDGDLLQFLRHRCKYMLELEDAGVNYSDPECDADFDRTMIMTVKQLLMFAVQISYGLEYLSQKGFVHRDVAARNILVHEKTHAKIGDFGLCRFIYADSSNYKGRGGRLPIKWMSPEAIRHYEFTTSSDVWSFGVLMFEIITLGGTPYPGIQPDDMLAFLESGQRIVQPDNCPDEYYKVMHACWAADPRIRPDFGAVRQQLALQLENVSDEYAYLKLDAKKDYYNVSYGELKAQRGENVEEDLRKAAEEEAKKEKRTKEKTEDEDEEKDEKDENDEEKDENDEEEREVKEGGAEEKKEDEKEDENGSSQMNPTQTRHHNVGIGIGNGIGIGLSSRERKEQQQQQLGAAGAEELVKVAA